MKNNSLIQSFKFAFIGIFTALKKERNMKIHYLFLILVVISGFILKISLNEWLICLVLFGLVISSEMFNTAIETVVDIASPNKSELAKIAKDIASGAVLINAIIAAIIGLIIFIPKIILFVESI